MAEFGGRVPENEVWSAFFTVALHPQRLYRLVWTGSSKMSTKGFHTAPEVCLECWWWSRASCPRMSVDILGTNSDQCVIMVQCCLTPTETVRLIRMESSGWPPQLSHNSWTLAWNVDVAVVLLTVLGCQLTYKGQAETNAWAWFNIALRLRKP